MRLNIQTKNKKEYVYLPMNENDLDRTCKRLDIKNNMTETVKRRCCRRIYSVWRWWLC